MRTQSLAGIFESWWNGTCNYKNAEAACKRIELPFTLRLVVSKDIPPRHPTFDWIRGFGVKDSLFTSIFRKESMPFREGDDYMFSFPEHKMSIHECQGFIYALKNHQDCSKLKTIDILTSAPFIISDTPRECISIIAFPDGISDDERYRESETARF